MAATGLRHLGCERLLPERPGGPEELRPDPALVKKALRALVRKR
jgi:hypothetical protein